jgi:hypothetical protein
MHVGLPEERGALIDRFGDRHLKQQQQAAASSSSSSSKQHTARALTHAAEPLVTLSELLQPRGPLPWVLLRFVCGALCVN